MIKNILLVSNLVLVIALGTWVLRPRQSDHQVFMLNQKVFDGFQGKKELEAKLGALRAQNTRALDSIAVLVNAQPDNQSLFLGYRQKEQELRMEEQRLSDQYTADIWKQINVYVSEFGKEKGYEFIFGAAGDGGLMYASDKNDVTEDVIQYINKRYSSGE